MEENMVANTENEEVLETQVAEEVTTETPIAETGYPADDAAEFEAADTPVETSIDETPIEKVEGEEVKEGEEDSKADPGTVEALGAMMGGLAESYNAQQKTQENLSQTLETQKKIFDAFDKNIENAINNIDVLNTAVQDIDKTVTELQASLTATKMYTQLLSKAILVSDVIMIIGIIFLAIFK